MGPEENEHIGGESSDVRHVLDVFAATVGEHWRAARDRTLRLFSTPVSWLEAHRNRPPDHHLTRGGKLTK
ncbi:MAG TPA: hypothetical protein VKQ31_03890 [Steroidobacteraceae bacterium]|nr:hypothetical protein [Steroidobacteraceae bacterium]